MSRREDIETAKRLMESGKWDAGQEGWVVDTSTAKVVHSARIPPQYSQRLEAEASRRGTNPSALIAEFVISALEDIDAAKDQLVTLRRMDLHRALDEVLRKSAA